jgi:phytoene synthase
MPFPTADARHCERITNRHAHTFALASRFLSGHKRRAAFAIYAFCRTADDIVDEAIDDRLPNGLEAASALDDCRRQLDRAIGGAPVGPVFRELAWTIDSFHVEGRVLHELLDGVGRDLNRATQPASWDELARYCEGVASTVGEMCATIFGVRGDRDVAIRARRYARALGLAMQVTNILRDVGEDAARGRCYLPADELAAFGLTREDVLSGSQALARDERWRSLMALQVGRARALYEAAAPGLALVADDARRCAVACATGYAAILDAIEAQRYDTMTRRARVKFSRRASLLYRVWRDEDAPSASAAADGPAVLWDGSLRITGGAGWA